MFDRGPGGRRHGDPLFRSNDEAERLDVKERQQQRRKGLTREERLARGPEDFVSLTGDPNLLPEDIADADAPPMEFIVGMEKQVDAYLDGLNEHAKAAGIRQDNPLHDRAITDEYYSGPPPGLDESTLAAERERLSKPFHYMSRSDVERGVAQLQWTSDLQDDFLAAFPAPWRR